MYDNKYKKVLYSKQKNIKYFIDFKPSSAILMLILIFTRIGFDRMLKTTFTLLIQKIKCFCIRIAESLCKCCFACFLFCCPATNLNGDLTWKCFDAVFCYLNNGIVKIEKREVHYVRSDTRKIT